MSFSTETCNILTIITTVLLGLLAFTKDLSEKYPKAKPFNRIWLKIIAVMILTLIGWKLSNIKSSNADRVDIPGCLTMRFRRI